MYRTVQYSILIININTKCNYTIVTVVDGGPITAASTAAIHHRRVVRHQCSTAQYSITVVHRIAYDVDDFSSYGPCDGHVLAGSFDVHSIGERTSRRGSAAVPMEGRQRCNVGD
jgi:hypothetical protein